MLCLILAIALPGFSPCSTRTWWPGQWRRGAIRILSKLHSCRTDTYWILLTLNDYDLNFYFTIGRYHQDNRHQILYISFKGTQPRFRIFLWTTSIVESLECRCRLSCLRPRRFNNQRSYGLSFWDTSSWKHVLCKINKLKYTKPTVSAWARCFGCNLQMKHQTWFGEAECLKFAKRLNIKSSYSSSLNCTSLTHDLVHTITQYAAFGKMEKGTAQRCMLLWLFADTFSDERSTVILFSTLHQNVLGYFDSIQYIYIFIIKIYNCRLSNYLLMLYKIMFVGLKKSQKYSIWLWI